jgi:hypothetical protein
VNVLAGGCHCGRMRAKLATAFTAETLPIRADQCGFCRRHGALSAGGPDDELTIELAAPVTAYRFGAKTADFLICPRCGVYVAAVMRVDAGFVGVVNARTLDAPGLAGREGAPVSYEGETAEARRARRAARWARARLDPAFLSAPDEV